MLLLSLLGLAIGMRKGGAFKGLFGHQGPPKCSPSTTLLVTDIENSTLCWCEASCLALRRAAAHACPLCVPAVPSKVTALEHALPACASRRREGLPTEAMNQAVELHHGLVRQLLRKFMGYGARRSCRAVAYCILPGAHAHRSQDVQSLLADVPCAAESATEGDSFIVSFYEASSALSFATGEGRNA